MLDHHGSYRLTCYCACLIPLALELNDVPCKARHATGTLHHHHIILSKPYCLVTGVVPNWGSTILKCWHPSFSITSNYLSSTHDTKYIIYHQDMWVVSWGAQPDTSVLVARSRKVLRSYRCFLLVSWKASGLPVSRCWLPVNRASTAGVSLAVELGKFSEVAGARYWDSAVLQMGSCHTPICLKLLSNHYLSIRKLQLLH